MTKLKTLDWSITCWNRGDARRRFVVHLTYITLLSGKSVEAEARQEFKTYEDAWQFVQETVEL